MRLSGLLLITLGFLGGTLASVVDPHQILLAYFIPALATGALGVGLVHIGARRRAQDRSRIEANFQVLDESLRQLVEYADELDRTKVDYDVYALPGKIDHLFAAPIEAFVEARESIAHVWGTQAYADVMTHFAAAERYLHRVWSTAADGYIDEAHAFIGHSRDQFRQALERLESLGGQERTGTADAPLSAT